MPRLNFQRILFTVPTRPRPLQLSFSPSIFFHTLLFSFFHSNSPVHKLNAMTDQTLSPNDTEANNSNNHEAGGNCSSDQHGLSINIYPLSCYYFGSKDPSASKEETLADRVQRMKSNYFSHGLRTCVEGVMLVELFKHPHLLLLQLRNSTFKLPGGRLRPGEADIDGLKRKLSRKLSVNVDEDGWEVGECLGMWWRSDFETLLHPYLPPNAKLPKECIKLFLVRLPASRNFIVPKNFKLLAVPLCQIHENHKVQFLLRILGVWMVMEIKSANVMSVTAFSMFATSSYSIIASAMHFVVPIHLKSTKTYGPIISGVPQLLSKFSFNIINS